MKKVLLLFVAMAGFTILDSASSHSQWLDPWSLRSAVAVSYSGASTLTNYQVRIALNSSFDFTKVRGDGSDIRLTAGDGTTLLPFWIESWDSTGHQASIWVKVPTIPSGGTTLYLYCGNRSATTASSGTATFSLFDDNWIQPFSNPVITANQDWWELDLSFPMVFGDNSFSEPYHMLYDGHGGGENAKGYASSSDLIHWTEYDNGGTGNARINPIMGLNHAGGTQFAWGDAIKLGTTFHVFPSSGPGTTVHAQSTDLITWTNHLGGSAPFDALTSDDPSGIGTGVAILKQPDGITPIQVDGKYWMVYSHGSGAGSIYMAYTDVSGNLLTWTTVNSGNPVLTPESSGWEGTQLWTPSFVEANGTYYIYYQGGNIESDGIWQIGFASAPGTSGGNPVRPDAVTWTKSTNNPVITNNHGWDNVYAQDPALRSFNGIYYLFYTGGSSVGNGFATSMSPEGPWTQAGSSGVAWTEVGPPTVTGGIMSFSAGQSIQSPATYSPGSAFGFRARFSSNPSHYKWAGFTTGGSPPYLNVETAADGTDQTDLLLTTYDTGRHYVSLGPANGTFHTYEITWLSSVGRAFIDHSGSPAGSLNSAIPSGPLPVQVQNATDASNTVDVDWVYVRKYSEPEPTTDVGPLPIQLTSFVGKLVAGRNVLLEWETLSEVDNYGFEVQRSATKGTNYQTIAGSFVPGQRTTLVPQAYSYVDSSAAAGAWYYRLKQMDLDGTVHYTEAVLVDVPDGTPKVFALEQNYPNPFNPSTTIRYDLPKASHVTLKVFNTLGQEVSTLVDEVQEAGTRSVKWNAGAMASGVYFYRIQAGSFVEMKKLLLLK